MYSSQPLAHLPPKLNLFKKIYIIIKNFKKFTPPKLFTIF